MSPNIPVIEAVEWREPAPGGGSQAQVFRLSDGRFAIVKFPENGQGEFVLADEFLCCVFAAHFDLPINRVALVSIDERLLRLPRQNAQIPASFSAGIRCGMIRFDRTGISALLWGSAKARLRRLSHRLSARNRCGEDETRGLWAPPN